MRPAAPLGAGRSLLARSVFSNHVGVLGNICIAFVMSPVMVNSLGDTRYGIWSILSALGGYLVLLDFGIGSAITRFVARDLPRGEHDRINRVIGSAFCIYLALSTLLLLLAPLIAWGLERYLEVDERLTETLWWLGILTTVNIAISLSSGLLRGTLLGHQRYDIMNAMQLGMSVAIAVVMYTLLHHGFGLIALTLVSTGSNVLGMGIVLAFIRRRYPYIRFHPARAHPETVRQVAHFGKFSFLSMLAGQFVFYSDALVIGVFHSVAAVTYYSIATMLIEYANRLIRGVSTAYMPHFSGLESSRDAAALIDPFIAGSRFVLLLSNLLCTGLLVLGGSFIGIWMGPQYAEVCTPIVLVLLIMQYLRGPQLLAYALLHGVGLHGTHSYWNFGFAAANVVLSVLLVREYGIMGVALATVLTQVLFHGVVSPRLSCGYLGLRVSDYYKRTLLRSLPSMLVLFLVLLTLLRWSPPTGYLALLLQSAAGTAAYLLAAWITLLDRSERTLIAARFASIARTGANRASVLLGRSSHRFR